MGTEYYYVVPVVPRKNIAVMLYICTRDSGPWVSPRWINLGPNDGWPPGLLGVANMKLYKALGIGKQVLGLLWTTQRLMLSKIDEEAWDSCGSRLVWALKRRAFGGGGRIGRDPITMVYWDRFGVSIPFRILIIACFAKGSARHGSHLVIYVCITYLCGRNTLSSPPHLSPSPRPRRWSGCTSSRVRGLQRIAVNIFTFRKRIAFHKCSHA